MVVISGVVEGHGDRDALPVLVRRIVETIDPQVPLHVPTPIRSRKGTLIKLGGLERCVQLASGHVEEGGGVLVVLDADGDCAGHLAPALLARANVARADVTTSVVFAVREFESWFLASATSLGGSRRLAPELPEVEDPESVRGPKDWIESHMGGGKYAPTIDQAALASRVDVALARERSDSFDKLCREVQRLVGAVRTS